MKVFACERDGNYSGGVAMVAANSKEEAFVVFHTDIQYDWMLDNKDIETGEFTSDINRCDSYYYKRANWFELPELTADVEEPRIIIEDGYTD